MSKKRNQTYILLALLVTLTLGALTLKKVYWTSDSLFSEFAVTDTANITGIVLSDREGRSITLDRMSPSRWRLNKMHDANDVVIESLLKTICNIEVKGMVPRSGHNAAVSDLAAKNTLVQIYQRKPRIKLGKLALFPRVKLAKAYFVGGPTQDHLGTYMKLEDDDNLYITHVPGQNAYLSLRYSTREGDWRDHTVIALTINQIKAIDVEIPGKPEESYRIEKTGERTFSMLQFYNKPVTIPLDTLRVLDFLAAFRNIKYEGLLNDIEKERKDSIVNSSPMQTITVEGVDGARHTITTFRRKSPYPYDDVTGKELIWDRDRLYALINNGKDLTLCQFYSFDDILKPFTWFRADFNPETGALFYEE